MDRGQVFFTKEMFLDPENRPASTIELYRYALEEFQKHRIEKAKKTKHRIIVDLDTYIQKVKIDVFYKDLKEYADYVKTLTTQRGDHKKLSQNTIKSRLMPIRAFGTANGLELQKELYDKLFEKRNGKKIRDELHDEMFTLEQARKTAQHLTIPNKALFLVLFSSGMRVSEALQLTLDDIDWKTDPVSIHIRAETTKTDTARTCYISRECTEYLKNEWLPIREQYMKNADKKTSFNKEKIHHKDDTLLFRFTKANFDHQLHRATDKAGLTKSTDTRRVYHTHSTRKSFATIMGMISTDAKEALLGHKTGLNENYARIEPYLPELYKKAEPGFTLSGAVSPVNEAQIQKMQKEIDLLSSVLEIPGVIEAIK